MSNTKKRVVTSAIQGMSVAEVRRGLDVMRRMWRERTPAEPFFLCDPLFNDMQVQEFTFRFVMGHHYKRHNKSRKEEEEEEEEVKEEEEEEEEEADTEADKRQYRNNNCQQKRTIVQPVATRTRQRTKFTGEQAME
jgi:hypothetical protein